MFKRKSRGGRPGRQPDPGERVKLGLRVTPSTKKNLDDAAARSGRSQSQEAEFRLERSFDRQELLAEVLTIAFGRRTAGIVLMLAYGLEVAGGAKLIEKGKDPSADNVHWVDDPVAFGSAVEAARGLLDGLRPGEHPDFAGIGEAWRIVWAMQDSLRESARAGADAEAFKEVAATIRPLLGPLVRRIDENVAREGEKGVRPSQSAGAVQTSRRTGT